MGHNDVRGRSMTMYAKGFAQDAIMNFHNQVNVKKGEDLGMTHFLYNGDLISASRPFCITRAGKTYSKQQILSWDKLSWKGKAGPAMSERGGYNCRHHWRPVRPEWIKDEDGEPISREEMVAYMNPSVPGVSKVIGQIEKKEIVLSSGQGKLKELQAKQTIFKSKKAAGKATSGESKAYALLRTDIKAQQVTNSVIRADIKELRVLLKGEGKKILKEAKITSGIKKVKVKKPKKSVVPKVSKPEITKTKLVVADSDLRLIKYPQTSQKFFDDTYDRLNKVPMELQETVRAGGFDIAVGDHITEVVPRLKGVQPRGWPDGTDWDYVGGLSDPVKRQIVVAERQYDFDEWIKPSRTRADNTFFHEFGHALDHSVDGGNFSSQKAFIDAYNKDYKIIRNKMGYDFSGYDYFLQEGRVGRQETFAQLFSNMFSKAVGSDKIDDLFVNTAKVMRKEYGLSKVVKKAKVGEKKVLKGTKIFKEIDDEDYWLKKYEYWNGELSDDQLNALVQYKSDNADSGGGGAANPYELINGYLRKKKWAKTISKDNKNYIRLIDKAMDSSYGLPDDVILYRGISKNLIKDLEKNVGKVVSDKAFTSTTTNVNVAFDFSGQEVIMKIKAPSGTRGVYMGFRNIDVDYLSESEVLLGRNTKLRVLGKRYKADDHYFIDVEIIPDNVIRKAALNPMPPMAEIGSLTDNYIRKEGNWFLKGKEVSKKVADDLDKLRVPPAWKNVVVSTDPKAKIKAIGLDNAGRWQYRYSADHTAKAARLKFDNVRLFAKDMPKIRKNIWKGINAGDDRAFLLELENRTVIRAGTDVDLGAKIKAYGLTTLQNEHAKIVGNRIILDFTAKKGIAAHYEIEDRVLANWLRVKKNATTKGQKLFPDLSAKKLNDYLKEISGKRYTIKDFRTYHGTKIAHAELKKYAGKTISGSEKRVIVQEVSEKVAAFLHNTPAMARGSYIDPIVWDFIGGL